MKILVLAMLGCLSIAESRAQPGFSEDEIADIYIAALNGETRQDPAREVALNRYLMTDSGHFSPAGRMPDRVVERLRARGLFSEICGEGPDRGAGPGCLSQRARGEIRLSRPIPRGRDSADVYIGGGSLRPANDTPAVLVPVGGTTRCRLVREGGRWMRQRCEDAVIS